MTGEEERMTRLNLNFDWDTLLYDIESDVRKRTLSEARLPAVREELFSTSSTYCGHWPWNCLDLCIYGTFTFPYPTVYEGQFFDGEFSGKGTLHYPMGQVLKGLWDRGRLVGYQYYSRDEMPFTFQSKYLQLPNRTFATADDLKPAGSELIFAQMNESRRRIRKGCYDTKNGFYDPKSRLIRFASGRRREKAEEKEEASEQFAMEDTAIVSEEKAHWIEGNCRKAWDEPVGYKPELYENWGDTRTGDWDTSCDKHISSMSYIQVGDSDFDLSAFGGVSSSYSGTGRVLSMGRGK